MPVRRGHVAPRTTLIETIIRKFDTDSKYTISIQFEQFIYCVRMAGVVGGTRAVTETWVSDHFFL